MKKQTKVTPWFPANVKPVRKGVYQVNDGLVNESVAYAYWNGSKFGYRVYMGSPLQAYEWADRVTCLSSRAPWRGLAKAAA